MRDASYGTENVGVCAKLQPNPLISFGGDAPNRQTANVIFLITVVEIKVLQLLVSYVRHCVYMFSGGTKVTVTGSRLDSVAVPRINLTVVISTPDNDSISTASNSQVLGSNIIDIINLSQCCIIFLDTISWCVTVCLSVHLSVCLCRCQHRFGRVAFFSRSSKSLAHAFGVPKGKTELVWTRIRKYFYTISTPKLLF